MKSKTKVKRTGKSFGLGLPTLLVVMLVTPSVKGNDLQKLFEGSRQERVLDAQVERYQPQALENIKVFDNLDTRPRKTNRDYSSLPAKGNGKEKTFYTKGLSLFPQKKRKSK